MKWKVSTPPVGRPIDWATLKLHCKIDTDEEQTLVEGYEDAAVDYAQDEMGTSLMPQTITATYYSQDVPTPPSYPYVAGNVTDPFAYGWQWGTLNRGVAFRLPRGPILSVTSVTDAIGNALTANTDYVLEAEGFADLLRVSRAVRFPMTVVYQAGYADATTIPAAVRQALLVHTSTLYVNRESVSAGAKAVVPHSLADFYRLKQRSGGIG